MSGQKKIELLYAASGEMQLLRVDGKVVGFYDMYDRDNDTGTDGVRDLAAALGLKVDTVDVSESEFETALDQYDPGYEKDDEDESED